jgi:hypothetical protein
MTEQQRREQIMKARQQQMQQRQTAPAMSDADAMRIAAENGAITQEQVVMAAMLGKLVNGGLNDLKKMSVGEGLKVGSVDMSKVMPSGIAKAMNLQRPQAAPPPPAPEPVVQVDPVAATLFPPIPEPSVVIPMPPVKPPRVEPNDQLELDFDKKTKYEDIELALEKVRADIRIVNEKLDKVIEYLDKKKLITQQDGTQTG